MNPVEQLLDNFQDLVGQVPEIIQPVIVMLAGAIPFIEGEVASLIGVVGGLNPIVAGIAAAAGNFLRTPRGVPDFEGSRRCRARPHGPCRCAREARG